MAASRLRILMLEDSPDDAELLILQLTKQGLEFDGKRVDTRADFIASLSEPFDLILADYALPNFTGLQALDIVKDRGLDIPFILISGTIGEDVAVEAIKLGAHDYLLKGKLTRLGSAIRNALQEKTLRDEKSAAEEKYHIIFENAQEGIFQTTPEGQYIMANPAAAHITGYDTPEELMASVSDLNRQFYVRPGRREEFINLMEEHDAITDFESEIYRKDGSTCWIAENVHCVRDGSGKLLYYEGTTIDITARKLAEESLRQSEANLVAAQHIAQLGSWEMDLINFENLSANPLHWSDELFRIFGYDPHTVKITNELFYRAVHPDDRSKVEAADAAAVAGDRIYVIDYRITRRDAAERILHERAEVIYDDEGHPVKIIGTTQDVTDARRLEEARREAETRYRLLVERIPAITYIISGPPSYQTIYISPQVKDILGFTPEEWMADPNIWEKQIHPEDHERVMAEEQASRAKDYPFVAEYRIRTKDGRVVWLHDETYHITDVPGVPPYSQGIEFDITERMERDRELQAIANISASLRAAQTLDQMLPILLDSSMKAVNAASGDVWLADLTKNELHMVFERGRVGEPLPNIKFGEGIVGHVTASGEVYVSQEWRTDPKVHESARNLIQPGLGGACIPIRAADKIIGAFFINMESPFKLKDADIHLLTTLAEIGGNAIQRASLYEQTVKQVEQLAALRAIDLMITSSLDLRMTLNVVLDQVINQLKIDAASILTFGQESKILRYAAGKGFWTNQIEATALRLGEGLPSQAVLQRQIVYVEDLKGAANAARLELLGDEKFVSYYAIPLIAKGKVKGVLEIFNRSKLSRSTEWQKFLEALGDQAAIAIDNSSLFLDLQRSNLELALAYDATIEGWSHALDLRDKETEGHTQRVTEMTLRLARAMGISEEDLVHMRRGALLHDIGKMGVPDNILLKPDKLTDEEWKIMRKHPDFANDMLSEIIYLRQALSIPYCHHEKWDGSGYPRGLKSEEIPLPARIFAIVDVWDALSSDRPYRPGWKKADVMKYIREQSGTHFDPRVVEAFLQLMSNGHFA